MNHDSTSQQRWLLALTTCASFLVALDLLVVSTALTSIRLDLGGSIGQVQWTVTAYGLSFAVLLLTGSALGDRFGRRRVFTVGLAVFAAASAACALAPDLGWLATARAVQGAGAALVMPLAVALLGAGTPAYRRGRALGLFEGLTGLATIAGPPLGGAVAHLVGWQWVFWINVPITLAMIPLVVTRIEESRGADTTLDGRGVALVTAGALALVGGLVHANTWGWTSPELLGALSLALLATAGFVRRELRTREPMLPMRLFASRTFASATAASFLLFAALYGSVFLLAQFMQVGLGHDALEAGLRLVPWSGTLFVVAPLAGVLADQFGNRPVLTTGLALNAAGLAWIALIAAPGLAYSTLVVPLVVTGVGASMAIPVVQNAVLGAVAAHEVGKASGANTMTQELAGVLGVAILVAVFGAAGGDVSAQAFVDGFVDALAVCAALAAGAAVASLAVAAPAQAPAMR